MALSQVNGMVRGASSPLPGPSWMMGGLFAWHATDIVLLLLHFSIVDEELFIIRHDCCCAFGGRISEDTCNLP